MRKKLLAAMAGLKERAKTLVELADGARFIVAERPLALDNNAAGLLTAEARNLLGDLSADLKTVEPWSAETTEQAVRAFAERKGVKLGSVAQPLRAALTGRTTSPPIFDVLAVLGKSESLGRLDDQAAPGVANR
jgi:glutamyl-tRNA synthetase